MKVPKGNRSIPPHAKKVFQGNIFSVWQWEQELYDGSTAIFEHITRSDTVHTVGILPDKRILLTYDYQPDRDPVITPSGGRVEEGETPKEAAKREFLEETGYKIGELRPWHSYFPFFKGGWEVHAFIGRNIKRVGEPTPEAGEKIELRFYTFDEFLQLGHHPELRDWKIRTILLEALLDPNKRQELYDTLYT